MSPPKILPRPSLPLRGGLNIGETALMLCQHCSAVAKTLVCYQHLSSYQRRAQHYEGCYGENKLHLSQTQYRISVGVMSWCLPLQPWQAARQPEDMAHLFLASPQPITWVAKGKPNSYAVLRAYPSTQPRTLVTHLLHLGCYIHLKWLDYSLCFREISQVTRAGGAGPLTSMKTW